MTELFLIPQREFLRVNAEITNVSMRLTVLADMCRVNALTAVKKAGSGHLGSSFSSLDIVSRLYFSEMKLIDLGLDSPDRDIFFSSKGHDVPGQYAVLHALGILSDEKLLSLRCLGGLDGHPDVGVPGIEANTGSLGMGISKGRGHAWGKKRLSRKGRVFVMTGDGEFQEGQNYEALQAAGNQRLGNLIVIMDKNTVQSDKTVSEINDIGDIVAKARYFGWFVDRCNGHDQAELAAVFHRFRTINNQPKLLIADTIKGRGVSFMEHPVALRDGGGYYKWHAGAPADEPFKRGHLELVDRINRCLKEANLDSLKMSPVFHVSGAHSKLTPTVLEGEPVSRGASAGKPLKSVSEYVVDAYGQALMEIAEYRKDVVVLDADLAADCRVRQFELRFPERFIECGIAEQDMVSMAGGLAQQGLLPVVNSFASFLASRANEQIYNNATEQSKIIYVCHYAGLIPAGPGKSHQSIRDISLFGALPNFEILQPCNQDETKQILDYAVNHASVNVMIRLAIGPSPRNISLPEGYVVRPGRGIPITEGKIALLFAYGPVMMHEALVAAEILADQGMHICVTNMPWLNRVDRSWLHEMVSPFTRVAVLDDHSPVGGLGDCLLNECISTGLIQGRIIEKWAVEGYPCCGTPPEALKYHGLDGHSLSQRVIRLVKCSI
jgi:transketolase